MPITKSAKRALRRSEKRRILNLGRKKSLKEAVKKFLHALERKDINEAKNFLSLAYKKIDKSTKSFLNKNKARRMKSRLALRFNKVFEKAEALK